MNDSPGDCQSRGMPCPQARRVPEGTPLRNCLHFFASNHHRDPLNGSEVRVLGMLPLKGVELHDVFLRKTVVGSASAPASRIVEMCAPHRFASFLLALSETV